MKAFSTMSLLGLLLAVATSAAEPAKDAVKSTPPHIGIAELGPQHDGQEVHMTFTVAETYVISGSVAVGQVPSFGITPALAEGSPRFGVLVSGDLADIMYRFGIDAPSGSAKGIVMEATGKITVFPAPKDNAEKGQSFQLNIRDWKGFRIIPDPPGYLQEFRLLKDQCDDRLRLFYETFEKEYNGAKTADERERLNKSLRGEVAAIVSPAVRNAFELVQPHAAEGVAIEPLLWIASQGGATDHGQKAAVLLIEYHLTSPKTIELAFGLRQSDMKWVEQMLRAQVAARALPEDQRPRQMLALAQTLHSSVERRQGDVGKLADETIQLFTELGQKYADKEYRGGVTFGELAKSSLFEIKSLSIGKIAPDIEGDDLNGVTFKLSASRGKVVMISFWATWCGPCMAELPHERELVKKYEGRPFVLIGVNADPDKGAVIPLLEKKLIPWRSFWCGDKGPLGPIPRTWNVNNWPTVYLIDHAGVIQAKELQDGILEKLVAEAERAMNSGAKP